MRQRVRPGRMPLSSRKTAWWREHGSGAGTRPDARNNRGQKMMPGVTGSSPPS